MLFWWNNQIDDFDFENILLNKKSYQNIFVYDTSYKTLFGVKPLPNRFDTLDRFITVCDGTIYLVSFGPEKYDAT